MKNKIVLLIVGVYSLIIIGFQVNNWIQLQDTNLLLLRGVKLEEGTLTARKASQAFMLELKFKLMPRDVEDKDFIKWCRENDVKYIFWGALEYQSRPKLRIGEWIKECKVLWSHENWGAIWGVK